MRQGYGSHSVSVTTLAATNLVYRLLVMILIMSIVDYVENALFKSYGIIC